MQTTPGSKRAALRLAILMAGSSLAIGLVVWLMVSFWPRPVASLPAEAAVAVPPAPGTSGPAKAVMGANPMSRAIRVGSGQANGSVNPATGAGGTNGNRTPRPIVIPVLTEKNRIVGPVPWRNGPPVRTPQPGAPAAKPPGTPRPNGPVIPTAVNGSGNRRSLPFMPPARNNALRPAPATPPAQAADGKGATDGN